jgi:hypothetical protein
MIKKIISGGQTGADQGALRAAKSLGLQTGGFAPRGFATEDGYLPALAVEFGLQEHSSSRYPARTQSNVLAADATLMVGQMTSPGSALTRRNAYRYDKPLFVVPWPAPNAATGAATGAFAQLPSADFLKWLSDNRVEILNVAGNRESQNPGIGNATLFFLLVNLRQALLLAACQAALAFVDTDQGPPDWDMLRAAIAKAMQD